MKLKNLSQIEVDNLIPDNLLFLAYRGSIAHGMYITNSDPNSIDDRDLIGCFHYPAEHYLGLSKKKETKETFYKEYDCVFYEFKKLIGMLLNSNPNVLSILWTDPRHILFESDIFKELKANRHWFVSRKSYKPFAGYASGQLKRMESFSSEGYMGTKRKALVEKYGYDTKNAAHCIRLLTMGIEFLTEGELQVERKYDAKYLLDIKTGKYSLDEIKAKADELFKLAHEAYIHCKLPAEPDYNAIQDFLINKLKTLI